MPRFQYHENALVIRIPTNCPAAMHHLLLKGMVATLKQSITSEKTSTDEDGLLSLTSLFEALLPTEIHLQKANE